MGELASFVLWISFHIPNLHFIVFTCFLEDKSRNRRPCIVSFIVQNLKNTLFFFKTGWLARYNIIYVETTICNVRPVDCTKVFLKLNVFICGNNTLFMFISASGETVRDQRNFKSVVTTRINNYVQDKNKIREALSIMHHIHSYQSIELESEFRKRKRT